MEIIQQSFKRGLVIGLCISVYTAVKPISKAEQTYEAVYVWILEKFKLFQHSDWVGLCLVFWAKGLFLTEDTGSNPQP